VQRLSDTRAQWRPQASSERLGWLQQRMANKCIKNTYVPSLGSRSKSKNAPLADFD
jgi:hypothetical protein